MFAFLAYRKSGLIKSCSSSEDLLEYKISWQQVAWCKFSIHLRSLSIRHSGKVEATELKSRGHLQCHHLPTEFHKDLLTFKSY
jgi:hypothetical protein